MRFLIKHIVLYVVCLFTLQLLFNGVQIYGGLSTYLIGAIILTILFYTLKPVLQIITLPLTFATLGFFTVLINTLILYITTVLVPSISISNFFFPGLSFLGFTVPQMHINSFFAYLLCAVVISCLTKSILWLFE